MRPSPIAQPRLRSAAILPDVSMFDSVQSNNEAVERSRQESERRHRAHLEDVSEFVATARQLGIPTRRIAIFQDHTHGLRAALRSYLFWDRPGPLLTEAGHDEGWGPINIGSDSPGAGTEGHISVDGHVYITETDTSRRGPSIRASIRGDLVAIIPDTREPSLRPIEEKLTRQLLELFLWEQSKKRSTS
jgi:hypothetical protein